MSGDRLQQLWTRYLHRLRLLHWWRRRHAGAYHRRKAWRSRLTHLSPHSWFRARNGKQPSVQESPFIQLTSGHTLSVTREEYDAARHPQVRRHMERVGFRTLCHAPFTSLDFAPGGYISPCNHFWHSLAESHDTFSILELWNSTALQDLRDQMINYTLDPEVCRHCIRQIAAGQPAEAFSVVQFDDRPTTERRPHYPKRLIFRLSNTCNLACIMCNGETSSRIRREFDQLPPTTPLYGERFFQDLQEILPHLEHVEFYGGEPFLVREHIRIFELIEQTGAQCSIYVNTNATSLNKRTKAFLEKLNFTCIAISMDAVSPQVHEKVRYGLRSPVFYETVAYYLDLRKRRRLSSKLGELFLMLNVTEHRKNWFEVPEIFRFAERYDLPVHINTCIHPENVTLYTLPTDQLQYVLEFTLEEGEKLQEEFPHFQNRDVFDFYLSLLRGELHNRNAEWKPPPCAPTPLSDGLLASPIPGLAPFDNPERVMQEAKRMQHLDESTRCRMLTEMAQHIAALPDAAHWREARQHVETLLRAGGSLTAFRV